MTNESLEEKVNFPIDITIERRGEYSIYYLRSELKFPKGIKINNKNYSELYVIGSEDQKQDDLGGLSEEQCLRILDSKGNQIYECYTPEGVLPHYIEQIQILRDFYEIGKPIMNMHKVLHPKDKMKMICAEDDEDQRDGLIRLLNRREYKIFGVKDGKEALYLYSKEKPHLIITGIKMPKMNGIELINEIIGLNPNQNFIVLSGYDPDDYRKEIHNFSGINITCFTKPVDFKKLVNKIKEIEDAYRPRKL